MTLPDQDLIRRREALVREHIAAENAHDVDRALTTFATPHYWVHPLGADSPGAEAVADLLGALFGAFPDFTFSPTRLYHASDAVVVEGRMTGTHRGPWAGQPASGRPIDLMVCCLFHFEEARLTSESVYFDHATLLSQIGPGGLQ